MRDGAGFFGREQELAELGAALPDAVAGRGRLFLLVGEPGIGKTRLASETCERAAAAGLASTGDAAGNPAAHRPIGRGPRSCPSCGPPRTPRPKFSRTRRRKRWPSSRRTSPPGPRHEAGKPRRRPAISTRRDFAYFVPWLHSSRGARRGSRSRWCSMICTPRTRRRCCFYSSSRASSATCAS